MKKKPVACIVRDSSIQDAYIDSIYSVEKYTEKQFHSEFKYDSDYMYFEFEDAIDSYEFYPFQNSMNEEEYVWLFSTDEKARAFVESAISVARYIRHMMPSILSRE